ncbi:class I SAM-dependent methyltransferase [Halomonas maura]|uniref:class I SAM-dependent methyltransferase n=1 Tax=Halomonas maura TaxID=117606 RepID=UPI0025B49EE4|nr:class I SAM-dependent methyltransferase [Halomonas maura]MDN3557939.1 class I SAM-dependent methyltransferase [Halomonas maura]
MIDTARQLDAHYDALAREGGDRLLTRLQAAFRAAGHDPDRLSLDTIAGIDQLHLGGRQASRALARHGAFVPGQRVLDVGCGTGGASRLLAAEHGVTVVGVDITAAFVAVADWLSRATGLAAHTRFLCADAARVPLPVASVDVVWCQHALINMPDLPAVLGEWRRLLGPGGRVLLHEVVAGDNPAPLALPVPWARRAATSHLACRASLTGTLAEAGFRAVHLEDVTESALAWRRKHGRRAAPPLPGPSLIFGDDFAAMGRNLHDNLADDRVRILAGVWERD